MFDTIKIKNKLVSVPKQVAKSTKTPFNWKGFEWIPVFGNNNFPRCYTSKQKNLQLKIEGNYLFITNSLQKYYKANNYTPFTYQEVLTAIFNLDKDLPIDVYTADIIKLSVGVVINENPKLILNEWISYASKAYTPMMKKNKIYGSKFHLTDYYLKGYDKTFEVKNHNQINLDRDTFRFEIEGKTKYFNNKTNNVAINKVNDLLDYGKIKKLGHILLQKYIEIEKVPELDFSTLSLKQKRMYAAFTNYEIQRSIKKQHPNTYKKERIIYNKMIEKLDNSDFQNQVINKLKDQINYSINN